MYRSGPPRPGGEAGHTKDPHGPPQPPPVFPLQPRRVSARESRGPREAAPAPRGPEMLTPGAPSGPQPRPRPTHKGCRAWTLARRNRKRIPSPAARALRIPAPGLNRPAPRARAPTAAAGRTPGGPPPSRPLPTPGEGPLARPAAPHSQAAGTGGTDEGADRHVHVGGAALVAVEALSVVREAGHVPQHLQVLLLLLPLRAGRHGCGAERGGRQGREPGGAAPGTRGPTGRPGRGRRPPSARAARAGPGRRGGTRLGWARRGRCGAWADGPHQPARLGQPPPPPPPSRLLLRGKDKEGGRQEKARPGRPEAKCRPAPSAGQEELLRPRIQG